MSTVPTTKIKAILLTVVVLALLAVTVVGLLYYKRIPSTGVIKTVGCEVYWDSGLTQKVTSLDWGIIEPGQEVNRSLYIKNTSNVNTNLTLATQNWNPNHTSNYITLYWTYNNQTLQPNEAIKVYFILAVAWNVIESAPPIKNFNFDIVIIASG